MMKTIARKPSRQLTMGPLTLMLMVAWMRTLKTMRNGIGDDNVFDNMQGKRCNDRFNFGKFRTPKSILFRYQGIK